ncbi:DMT family transporter [Pseudomonas sp. MS19]|uniref:EamA family transporter n=1 Tax=Pseudomonas sp. MS19 TaxID=2579939 RepID=UPI001561D26B|nr:DMT family transporter [Pseudomonas sp. MS19]NRH26291.1 DMT family transporter [Pseudomonas sp. MS19]
MTPSTQSTQPSQFPRHIAVTMLALLACTFGANHVAARVAFDHDTGVMLAVLCRSGVTLLILGSLVLYQRQPIAMPQGAWRWQALLGLCIAIQSLCLYSAVARIPVALALLVGNTFPMVLALLTWALGGPAPTRRTAVLMGVILLGLLLALDVPARLQGSVGEAELPRTVWLLGIALALCAACAFACALWLTEHKLSSVRGSVRSMLTMAVVFSSSLIAGFSGLIENGLALPSAATGWIALAIVGVLYSSGFSILFISMPRLDMPKNVSVMNVEPVATLILGWVILGQVLSPIQMVGALIVISAIVLLTYRQNH